MEKESLGRHGLPMKLNPENFADPLFLPFFSLNFFFLNQNGILLKQTLNFLKTAKKRKRTTLLDLREKLGKEELR